MNFPYIYNFYSTQKIMLLVIIACIPGIFTKYYFFGFSTVIQIFFSIVISLLFEVIFLKIRRQSIKQNLKNNSSIVTAILFGISIPSFLPWWITIIGLFFSIIVAKHLYGGIGQNIFNPAMVGYAVLLISFPIHMNTWNERDISLSFFQDIRHSINIIFFKKNIYNNNNIDYKMTPDLFTTATPLNDFKIQSHLLDEDWYKKKIFIHKKNTIKNHWKYINISFFLGGLFLFFKKIICWRIPLSFLSSLGIISMITYYYSQDLFMSPLFHFFSGGTMICAFFIATDPVTTSCTNLGKIIFGVIIGLLVWIIRNYSDYPDAIAFSVLFGNIIVPLIDHYQTTSGYGHSK